MNYHFLKKCARQDIYVFEISITHTISISKDNAAARRRLRRRITNTLRKPTTMQTKLAKESELVSVISGKTEYID
jgi:hypothetical protein